MKLLSALFIVSAITLCFGAGSQPVTHWVGTWACSPVGEMPKAEKVIELGPRNASVTIRNVVHVTLGGKVLRLRISNEFGATPVNLKNVHVALSDGQDAIKSGTDRAVTFSGATDFTIPAGITLLSDPVKLEIPEQTSLAISMYVPQQKGLTLTYHLRAISTNYYAPGDQAAATKLKNHNKIQSWIFLTGVDVQREDDAAAVVAFGDSITDGMASTVDANRRWPDDLARRFLANKDTKHLSVLNLGVGGKRILYEQSGPSLKNRLEPDVLNQAGVKYLIFLGGSNDIYRSTNNPDPANKESVADIIDGMKDIIARAHARGIKVFGGTITPYGSTPFYNETGEKKRQEINNWIRNSKAFDAVFDFDAAVRDPKNPTMIAPPYVGPPNSAHPGDAGYKAIADSIDMKQFN